MTDVFGGNDEVNWDDLPEADDDALELAAAWARDGADEPANEVDEQQAEQRDGTVVLPRPDHPMAVVRELEYRWLSPVHEGARTLFHWQGSWLRWQGTHWVESTADGMRSDLYAILERAIYTSEDRRGNNRILDWAPNRVKVANLMEALAAVCHLPPEVPMVGWLDGSRGGSVIVSCENGLLDVTTRRLEPHTPRFLNRASLAFSYDPEAPRPARWLSFLDSVWHDDPDAISTLQEWFGYVISGSTSLQKMLFIVGPPRSGKGTMARTLTSLVGTANVAGPTLASLGTNFGMAPLIKATLAVIDDARLPRHDVEAVMERLLTITGEGIIDVDRKNRDIWTGRIPARLMMLSNDLPPFSDASGAITSRMITLTCRRSFLGSEDPFLERSITLELPGILNWALAGLDKLLRRGKFTEPGSSTRAREQLDETVSPINAFLRECCQVDSGNPECYTPKDGLWNVWVDWCADRGRQPSNKINFGRMLYSAAPDVTEAKVGPRGQQVRVYRGIRVLPED